MFLFLLIFKHLMHDVIQPQSHNDKLTYNHRANMSTDPHPIVAHK